MYIIKPDTDEFYDEKIKKITEIIKNNQGEVFSTDRWGIKRLAYEIQDYNQGFYAISSFSASSKAVKELDRLLKIDEDILRHMIVRKAA